MNKEMLEAMKNRRSIRSYRKDLMIQEDVLQEILKTAMRLQVEEDSPR